MSALALILLTLVGYSSGAVLTGKGKRVAPGLLDLAAVVVLWVVALMAPIALEKWQAILAWLVIGLVVGAGLTGLRRRRYPDRKEKSPVTRPSSGRLRRGWERWKAFAAEIGNYQGRALLALFYFLVVTPFGVPVRLWSDPLRLHRAGNDSSWIEREPTDQGLERAREQF